MMNVTLNGEAREITEGATVASLVEELSQKLGFNAQAIIVEHNGVALRGEEWAGLSLKESDQLEFVRVVAGG